MAADQTDCEIIELEPDRLKALLQMGYKCSVNRCAQDPVYRCSWSRRSGQAAKNLCRVHANIFAARHQVAMPK